MHLSLVNPYIRVAMKFRISSGHTIARRVIYDYELIYLEEGRFTFIYNDKTYHCRAGDVIFIHPGVAHSFILNRGEISQPHIHFDITYRPQSEMIPVSFKDVDKMSKSEKEWIHKDYFSSWGNTPLLHIDNKPAFLEMFYHIVSGQKDDITKKSLMIKLIGTIVQDNFQEALQAEEKRNVANQIKDYIDAGNGMGMILDDFAKTFCYDKFYLERKFKEAFGINLIEYRNNKRMELASDMLKRHSVSEVAELLGYKSIYSFSRAYKLCFGYAPTKRGESVT